MMPKKVVEISEEKSIFQLFFLKEDEDQNVDVEEVEKIDFGEIEKRLEQGESVFIVPKGRQRLNTSPVAREKAGERWYFSHV